MMLHQQCLTSESHSEQQQCLLGAKWITSIAIVSCLFYLQATLVTWEFVCKLLQGVARWACRCESERSRLLQSHTICHCTPDKSQYIFIIATSTTLFNQQYFKAAINRFAQAMIFDGRTSRWSNLYCGTLQKGCARHNWKWWSIHH